MSLPFSSEPLSSVEPKKIIKRRFVGLKPQYLVSNGFLYEWKSSLTPEIA